MASRLLPVIAAMFLSVASGCASSAEEPASDESEGALMSPKSFDFNPASSKERVGEVELANAYWAARFADMAYQLDTEAQVRDALGALGIETTEIVAFHSKKSANLLQTRGTTGTDGFYVRTKAAGFLAFRGSEDGKVDDVVSDIRFIQLNAGPDANNAGDGEVHAGFYNSVQAVWDTLEPILKARHGDGKLPLYLIGHSLGGGLATIAAHHLLFDGCLTNALRHVDVLSICEKDFIPVKAVYTFGAPRVGNEEFTTRLSVRMRDTHTKYFRFVNEGDEVSMLPRYSPAAIVSPYRHVGDKGEERSFAILLDRKGAMFARPDGRCAQNPQLVQCDNTIWGLVDNATNKKPPWKIEHSRRLYIEKLRALVTGTAATELDKIRSEVSGAP